MAIPYMALLTLNTLNTRGWPMDGDLWPINSLLFAGSYIAPATGDLLGTALEFVLDNAV
jgi:hypothetical protein